MIMQLCASEAATPPAGAHSRARAVLSTLEIHQHTTLGTLPLHCGWLLLHAAAAQAWTLGPRRPVQVHTASGAARKGLEKVGTPGRVEPSSVRPAGRGRSQATQLQSDRGELRQGFEFSSHTVPASPAPGGRGRRALVVPPRSWWGTRRTENRREDGRTEGERRRQREERGAGSGIFSVSLEPPSEQRAQAAEAWRGAAEPPVHPRVAYCRAPEDKSLPLRFFVTTDSDFKSPAL